MSWFAIQTFPQAEMKALRSLERMGVTAACPVVVERRTRQRRSATVLQEVRKPMFSGYLFIDVAVIPDWLYHERSVLRPLPGWTNPKSISDELVGNALLHSGKITVDEWRQVQRFAAGDTVRRKGDTSGLTGTVLSADKQQLMVLFILLGESKVMFHQDQVEAAE